ncbi:MAG: hypothetical protein E7294_13930 [Lachnospiraceae bacterium]|nr:hypothetical protein [Lachnospiraceae bacterium]
MCYWNKKVSYKELLIFVLLITIAFFCILTFFVRDNSDNARIKIHITSGNLPFYVAVLLSANDNSCSNYNWKENTEIRKEIEKYYSNDWICDFVGKYEGHALEWIKDNKKKFKLLFYFPEKNYAILTQECEVFAKESTFIFHMNHLKEDAKPIKSYNNLIIVLSAISGMLAVLSLEIIIMGIFNFKNFNCICFVLIVNLLFQIITAVYLFHIAYEYGYYYLFIYLILVAFGTWIIKNVLYVFFISKITKEKFKKIFIYSIMNNTFSILIGIFMALLLPGIR